jgi:hypothetical protein
MAKWYHEMDWKERFQMLVQTSDKYPTRFDLVVKNNIITSFDYCTFVPGTWGAYGDSVLDPITMRCKNES